MIEQKFSDHKMGNDYDTLNGASIMLLFHRYPRIRFTVVMNHESGLPMSLDIRVSLLIFQAKRNLSYCCHHSFNRMYHENGGDSVTELVNASPMTLQNVTSIPVLETSQQKLSAHALNLCRQTN